MMSGEYQGQAYRYEAAVEVSGGLATSPHSAAFDPYHILRVQATTSELDRWLGLANQPGTYYVSAGE